MSPLKVFVLLILDKLPEIIQIMKKLFQRHIGTSSAGAKVLVELFQKLTVSRGRASCRTPQSAKFLTRKKSAGGEEKQSGGLFFVGSPSETLSHCTPWSGAHCSVFLHLIRVPSCLTGPSPFVTP